MKTVGVVAALEREARALAGPHRLGADPIELAPGAWLAVAGVGPERAARAGRRLVEHGARALVSWGVAGGLESSLRPGALVLATEVIDGERRWRADEAWRERLEELLAGAPLTGRRARPAFRAAPIAASARVLGDASEKAACGRASGAAVVDMESGALAELAAAEGLPLLCVRAVCDPVETSLPRCVLGNAEGTEGVSRAALLRSLALDPRQLAGVLALRAGFRAALRALRSVADAAGPGLCASEAA